jgi:hypothetical protein
MAYLTSNWRCTVAYQGQAALSASAMLDRMLNQRGGTAVIVTLP